MPMKLDEEYHNWYFIINTDKTQYIIFRTAEMQTFIAETESCKESWFIQILTKDSTSFYRGSKNMYRAGETSGRSLHSVYGAIK